MASNSSNYATRNHYERERRIEVLTNRRSYLKKELESIEIALVKLEKQLEKEEKALTSFF